LVFRSGDRDQATVAPRAAAFDNLFKAKSNPMSSILTDGGLSYEMFHGWGQLPDGWSLNDVAAVAVDKHDQVHVFNRGAHPMVVFDSQGNFLRSWGEGMFHRPHGLHIAHDDAIYCTDDGDHTLRKFSSTGKLLLQIGVPGKQAGFMSNHPFNRCTHSALSPDGEIYISDGYGNACVHRFSPDGNHLQTWGRSGCAPGEFYIPHNLCCDEDGWVYVADRENHRIQVFDGRGRYETEWRGLHRPCALCMGNAVDGRWYVGEAGPALQPTLQFPGLGPRISILNRSGEVLARIGAEPAGTEPGRFVAPHGIAVDSAGAVYVGEVSYTAWNAVFPGRPRPAAIATLHKLVPRD
jgi:DNA-binding beta-propeller fold protein YncE